VTTILDGKAIASELREQIAERVNRFVDLHGRKPGLHVVLAGDDQASAVYVANKEKAALAAGFESRVHRLAADVTQPELMRLIESLNEDDDVDGILVQLPLPPQLDQTPVLASVERFKDVDGFHAMNVGALWSGRNALVPCTPRACIHLLKYAGVTLAGARALIIGRSNIVGKPVAALLLAESATVTIAHSRTLDLQALCLDADIVVAAVGRPKLVKGDWLKPGAAVIDVGINRDDAGKLCGDVDFDSAKERAGVITPVPGGVGPMTIAMLMDNTLLAASARLAI
jgi:methylenetetrahydrofolate dehydrogenase (NADP+)/methenyltetrahydrofolate cyclohydrolase